MALVLYRLYELFPTERLLSRSIQGILILIFAFFTSSVKQLTSILSQSRCPELHEENFFWSICFFCNGFSDYQLEVLDDLKTSYHSDNSDDDELVVALSGKPGDENTACNFSEGFFQMMLE